MDALPSTFFDVLRDYGNVFEELPQQVFLYRMRLEDGITEFCESILLRRAELDSLAAMHFELAICDMIEYCFIGIAHNVLSIPRYAYLSTSCVPEAWEYALGVPHPPSYVPTLQDSFPDFGPSDTTFTDRLLNTYMVLGTWLTTWRMAWKMQTVFDRHLGSGFPSLVELAGRRTWLVLHVGGLGQTPPTPITNHYKWIVG